MTTVTIPTIETERLVLRACAAVDHPRFVEYYGDPGADFAGGRDDAAGTWRRMAAGNGGWSLVGFGMWVIEERATGLASGIVGGNRPFDWPENEIGWGLHPDARGRGIAAEAALAARQWLYREKRWTTAVSYIHPANDASQRLAERLGAVCESEIDLRGECCRVYRHPPAQGVAA